MKIILVNPPSDTYRTAEENLGLAYLKSFVSSIDFVVDIIDGYLFNIDVESIIETVIKDQDCKILGLSPYISSLKQSIYISSLVKKKRPDIHICWGGHLATFSANELLSANKFINSIVMGEGEKTFLELVIKIKNNETLENVKGLTFTNILGEVVVNPSRDLIENLDILPFPDRFGSIKSYETGSLVQISGSRGCYGNCSFCSINSIYRLSNGKTWRGRSPKNIVNEIIELNNKYNFSHFKFVDDSFFGPEIDWRERGLEIADGIIKSGLKIKFRISIRANNVDEFVFSKMKEAGLYAVSIGVESGSQRMLNTFNKGLTVKQNTEALNILKKLKIITLMGFIGFDPYITIDEIEENIIFLEENSFAVTDIISKPLFVHSNDAITKKLLADNLITGRDFPNYQYRIVDKKAGLIFKLIEKWNLNNKDLYYKVSNPLSAPRQTSNKEEVAVLPILRKLREIDLLILKNIVKMVKNGCKEKEILVYLDNEKNKYLVDWEKINKNFLNIKK